METKALMELLADCKTKLAAYHRATSGEYPGGQALQVLNPRIDAAIAQLRTAAAEGGEPIGFLVDGVPFLGNTACDKTAIPFYLHPPTDSGAGRDGWLPMDSAPMDGNEIDVWCPERDKNWGYRVADAYWCAASKKWHVNGESWLTWANQPSHWRPLPKGPEKQNDR